MKLRNVTFVCVAIMAFITTGCSRIPQAAIDVNKQVSAGISSLGENGIEMVDAWEQSAFNMLDERWSNIYEKADASYRSNKGIAVETALTSQQQEDVAGLSVLIRDQVREKISTEANSMRNIINSNTKNTLDANESITNLLASANAITTFQQSAIKEVGSLIPIPPVISDFINNTLQTAGL